MTRRPIGKPDEVRGGILVGRGHAHQPGQGTAEPVLAVGNERVRAITGNAGLLQFIPDIDFDQEPGLTALLRHRGGKRVGKPGTVETFDHLGEAHGIARLVGLEPADDMQAEPGKRARSGGNFVAASWTRFSPNTQ